MEIETAQDIYRALAWYKEECLRGDRPAGYIAELAKAVTASQVLPKDTKRSFLRQLAGGVFYLDTFKEDV